MEVKVSSRQLSKFALSVASKEGGEEASVLPISLENMRERKLGCPAKEMKIWDWAVFVKK